MRGWTHVTIQGAITGRLETGPIITTLLTTGATKTPTSTRPFGRATSTTITTTAKGAWGGSYFQLELDKYSYFAFVNVSGAQSWYRAIDYFRPNVVTLNDTTYEVRSTDEYRVLGDTEWQTDTTFLSADHEGLANYTTDWERMNSATIKAGDNYNFNEWVNAYTNVVPESGALVQLGVRHQQQCD